MKRVYASFCLLFLLAALYLYRVDIYFHFFLNPIDADSSYGPEPCNETFSYSNSTCGTGKFFFLDQCVNAYYLRKDCTQAILYNWNQVPGLDNDRFISFTTDTLHANWTENALITKTHNNEIINVTSGNKWIEIRLLETQNVTIVNSSEGGKHFFEIKHEYGWKNVYNHTFCRKIKEYDGCQECSPPINEEFRCIYNTEECNNPIDLLFSALELDSHAMKTLTQKRQNSWLIETVEIESPRPCEYEFIITMKKNSSIKQYDGVVCINCGQLSYLTTKDGT